MDNNILIADFMGWHSKPNTLQGEPTYFSLDYEIDDMPPDEMKFTSSWDWLMPVIKKCYEIEIDDTSNLHGDISCALLDTDIEETHKAVIEFIKWYNKQK